MNRTITRILLAIALALPAAWAQAAITCSTITSGGWSTAYVPSTAATNITQSTFTITCQRNVGTDPTTLNFIVSVDNGLHFQGQQNRGANGANLIAYENYQDSGCTNIWKASGGQRISGNMNLSGLVPTSTTVSYWGCVPGSQTGLPAGTYTDTVGMTARNAVGGATLVTGSFNVSIFTPAVCNITQAPGTVAFTYAAFRVTAATASTTFGVTCTSLLPYAIALDAPSGVVAGLQYLVSLSGTSSTGTGAQQSYTVNGTMPAGQAGTCATGSCSGTDTRTLTITY
jgi:spore coat protein U-like protein